uniref:Sushi domain-containing protein n=1 Tax=Seriola lalandi dorsalis TaxID=1841481 RepID=A0A3B4X0C8_SERLL
FVLNTVLCVPLSLWRCFLSDSIFPSAVKTFSSKQRFDHGEKVYYNCHGDFTPSSGSRSVECDRGQWTKLSLKCESKRKNLFICLYSRTFCILNGQFIYSGDNAAFIQTKLHAWWLGWTLMVCEEPEVTNAEMIGIQETYAYKAVLHYRCRVGTLIGQMDISCTKDGTWSAPPPKCQEMTCPPPNVPSAFWMRAYNDRYRYRDTISIECKPGYTMIGPSIITCENDGRWSPSLPKCRRTRNPVGVAGRGLEGGGGCRGLAIRCISNCVTFYLYGRRKAETLLLMRRMKERGSISLDSRVVYLK